MNTNVNIMYVGMLEQAYTFTMFDAQACLARDFILGKTEMEPDVNKRMVEMKEWGAKFAQVKDVHGGIDFQRDYLTDVFKVHDL